MFDGAPPRNPAATVHVIDDDSNFRLAVVSLLESFEMQAKVFRGAEEFLEGADLSHPGCILLDVTMPGMSGLELQDKLARLGNPLPIIFMTGNASVAVSVSAMKAGAFDFLLKPFKQECLLDVTSRAITLNAQLCVQNALAKQKRACVDSLTPREEQVFSFVSRGLLNKQIAHELNISEIMVKLHRGRMMRKLKARSVVDVVRMFDEIYATGRGHERRHVG